MVDVERLDEVRAVSRQVLEDVGCKPAADVALGNDDHLLVRVERRKARAQTDICEENRVDVVEHQQVGIRFAGD